ncbi:hypothetical protein ACQ9LF_03580 [Anaerohalosphaeraceae bacterium U12dextr]
MTTTGRKKRRHSGLKAFLFLILFALFILAVGLVLLGHTPRAYQPAAVPPDGQVSPYLTHKLGPDFFNNIQLDQPFELAIDQQGANEIFASQCPEPQEYGGFSFAAPAVTFTPKGIILMTTIGYKNATSVLSVTALPTMDSAGRLNLNIHSVNLGALPVTGIASKLARQYADEYLVPEDDGELAPIINGVINNQSFDPVMTISDYTVRLKSFKLEQGRLILQVEPVRKKNKIAGDRVP